MSLLSNDQKKAIIDILKEQCRCIQEANAIERDMFPNLYDAQYMSGRHHSNTAKVYAGFQEDTLIPGMSVKKISYGVQKWQPEVSSDTPAWSARWCGESIEFFHLRQTPLMPIE